MSLKRSVASFAFIIFGWSPSNILVDAARLTLSTARFDNFRNLMLFRSSDVIKTDHFHSTFFCFSLFSLSLALSMKHHFQWKIHKIIQDCEVFSHSTLPFYLSFFCFLVKRWGTFLKWLAFSFWDLLTIQRHNLILKSKAIQEQRRK